MGTLATRMAVLFLVLLLRLALILLTKLRTGSRLQHLKRNVLTERLVCDSLLDGPGERSGKFLWMS